jgi:outer membrane protein OmpA-like peptidoglycan-associated protein
LVNRKIDKSRLKYKGYGVSKPVYAIPEKNVEEENENRRVDILITDN